MFKLTYTALVPLASEAVFALANIMPGQVAAFRVSYATGSEVGDLALVDICKTQKSIHENFI